MNRIDGTAGNDFLHMIGDLLSAPLGFLDIMQDTSAADLIHTGNSDDIVYADDGDDRIYGGEGSDLIIGGNGSDTINGDLGDDSMYGGLGNDVFYVDSTSDLVVEFVGEGVDTVRCYTEAYELGANLEKLSLLSDNLPANLGQWQNGYGNGLNNTMIGNSLHNSLEGRGGNDTLFGGTAGDALFGGEGKDALFGGSDPDNLDGGAGADRMAGGAGDDTYWVDSNGDRIVESDNSGYDIVRSTLKSYTMEQNLEWLILETDSSAGIGNSIGNSITGTSGSDQIFGMDGNDTLSGGEGSDTINGGAGQDLMYGSSGNDHYVVDDIGDEVREFGDDLNDSVLSYVSFTLTNRLETLTLALGSGDISGTGSAAQNAIFGNDGNNRIIGLEGSDTLYGGTGNDTLDGNGIDLRNYYRESLIGGSGDDTYIIDGRYSIITEAKDEGQDSAFSAVSFRLPENIENLSLTRHGNTRAFGNSASNALSGNVGDNYIEGLAGNDTLTGGLGADQFVIRAMGLGEDVISDFNSLGGGMDQGDKIAFGIRLLHGVFGYVGETAFTSKGNTEVRVFNGRTLLDSNGDGIADVSIVLVGLQSGEQLNADCFQFI